jgi:hypothetical protein
MMQAGWNKNIRPYLKINQSKKQWLRAWLKW